MVKYMERYKCVSACLLAIVLLLGGLSACTAAENRNSAAPGERPSSLPQWASPLSESYAVIEVKAVSEKTMELQYPKDVLFRGVECEFLYFCNLIGYVLEPPSEVYFPEEWVQSMEPNRQFLVLLESNGTEVWVDSVQRDGKELLAFPFRDGQLVYDGSSGGINGLNEFLETAQRIENETSHLFVLLPEVPLGSGATVDETIQFFVNYETFDRAYWDYWNNG